jgi:hypothetical protein
MELMPHSTAEITLATYAQTLARKRGRPKKVASLLLLKEENVV